MTWIFHIDVKVLHGNLDFQAYLQTHFSDENLLFLLMILKYQKMASPFYEFTPISPTSPRTPGDVSTQGPTMPSNYTEQMFNSSIRTIKECASSICSKFLSLESDTEVNLPQAIADSIRSAIQDSNYHPSIFNGAFLHISQLLRHNFFRQFVHETQTRAFEPTDANIPKLSLQQIIDGETIAPYSKEGDGN